MEKMTLGQALAACGGRYSGDPALLDSVLADITTDSRKVSPGALFAAIPGERVDGHSFIPAAAAQGAIAALGQLPAEAAAAGLPYIQVVDTVRALGDIAAAYRQLFPVTVIGVSGSVGKTTCKEMLAAVLGRKFTLLKTEGNFNNTLGVPLTLFRLNGSHQLAVVEMGINHFHEMERLAEIARPDLAVFTNAGDAHLENLGDRAGVVRAKTEMCEYMQAGSIVFLNADDENFRRYQPPQGLRRCLYGKAADSDVRAESAENSPLRLRCRINGLELETRYHGEHLLYSILPAVAVGRELGMNDDELRDGVAAFAPPAGRGNITDTPLLSVIDSSYNANPTSMKAALDDLAIMPPRRVAVLGDMYELGADSAALHRRVGEYARGCCDMLLSVGGLAAVMPADEHFADPAALIAALPRLLRKGDSVLVKSSHSLHLDQVVSALCELR